MKNRLIVAAIGIPALLAVIFFTPIWGWGIVVAIMAAFCAWELLHTAMPKFVPRFAVYAGVCGAAIVLGAAFGKSELVFKIAAYVLFVTMFVEMMISFHKSERIPFQDLALVFTAGIIIPWMLSSLVRLGLNDPKAPYLLLPFVITWLSDSGAFFVGRSLGKTKLAPALSPHKTVEGCVGGFVCAIAAAMLYGLVLHLCGYRVQIGLLAIYGFFGSLAGQTGDLAFSAIKREHGVKDYSNLLPGHGGMLDRFDSTIFTAPMLELLVLLAPAGSCLQQAAKEQGVPFGCEVFADRAYEADGSLRDRRKPGAMITDTATAIDRVVRMVKEQKVTAYTGEDIPVVAHSVCVHGDGARALEFVQALRSAFAENGIAVAPLAEVIADV